MSPSSLKSNSKKPSLSLSTLYSSDETSSDSSSSNSCLTEEKSLFIQKPITTKSSDIITATVSTNSSVTSSTSISKTSLLSKCSVTSLTTSPSVAAKLVRSHSTSLSNEKTISRPTCKPSSKLNEVVEENLLSNRSKQNNLVKRPEGHKKTIMIPPTPMIKDRTKSQDSSIKHSSSSSSRDVKSQNKHESSSKNSSSILGKRLNNSRSNSDSSCNKRERNETRSDHKANKPSASLLSSTLSSSMKIKSKTTSSISNKLLDLPVKPKTCSFLPSSQRIDRPKKHSNEKSFITEKKEIIKDEKIQEIEITKEEKKKNDAIDSETISEEIKVNIDISLVEKIKSEEILKSNLKEEEEPDKVEKLEKVEKDNSTIEYLKKEEDSDDAHFFTTLKIDVKPTLPEITPPTSPNVIVSPTKVLPLVKAEVSPSLLEKPLVKIAVDCSPSETKKAIEQSLAAISNDNKVEVIINIISYNIII